jgi:hypothetical protein
MDTEDSDGEEVSVKICFPDIAAWSIAEGLGGRVAALSKAVTS